MTDICVYTARSKMDCGQLTFFESTERDTHNFFMQNQLTAPPFKMNINSELGFLSIRFFAQFESAYCINSFCNPELLLSSIRTILKFPLNILKHVVIHYTMS